MNVGVDSPLDRRASSGTNLCPGNRVRYNSGSSNEEIDSLACPSETCITAPKAKKIKGNTTILKRLISAFLLSTGIPHPVSLDTKLG